MSSLGDFDTSTVVYGKFTTYRPSTGAPFTLAGTPALSVYKDNSTTQSTTGVTLTVDFDSVTGLNHFAIDTSADGTFYSAGSFFDVVITTGTVDSVSSVGSVVGSFTIRKNSSLKPATAGRTLVVDAAGLADANTVKVGPTGAGTAQTARDIGAGVLLAAVTHTGATIPTVTTLTNLPAITAGWLTATGIAAGALNGKGDWNTTTPPTTSAIAAAILATPANLLATDASGRVLLQPTQTGVTIPIVTTLTNLPSIPANWLTAAGIAAGALNGKGDWSTTAPDNASVSAIKTVTDKLNTALELNAGNYRYTVAALYNAPSGGGGGASAAAIASAVLDELVTSHTTPNSLGADVAAIMAKTNTIGNGTVTVVSPLGTGNGLELIRGDDYQDTNARSLTWTDTGSTWASLVGSTVALVIQGQSFAGTVVDADNLKVQLTAAQTSGLAASTNSIPKYEYYLRATNGAGKVTTIVRGLVSIKDPSDF